MADNTNMNKLGPVTGKRRTEVYNSTKEALADLQAAASVTPTFRGSTPTLDTSNPFNFIVDQAEILGTLNEATKAAYDLKQKEALQGLSASEDTAYNNTINAINEMRNSLASSYSSGANRGAANATALQALLGLGQQNNALVTEGLRDIQNIADERAAQMAQNAVESISQSNAAKGQQATAANEKYAADTERYGYDANMYAADQATKAAALAAYSDLAASRNEASTSTVNTKFETNTDRWIADNTNKTNKKIAKITK